MRYQSKLIQRYLPPPLEDTTTAQEKENTHSECPLQGTAYAAPKGQRQQRKMRGRGQHKHPKPSCMHMQAWPSDTPGKTLHMQCSAAVYNLGIQNPLALCYHLTQWWRAPSRFHGLGVTECEARQRWQGSGRHGGSMNPNVAFCAGAATVGSGTDLLSHRKVNHYSPQPRPSHPPTNFQAPNTHTLWRHVPPQKRPDVKWEVPTSKSIPILAILGPRTRLIFVRFGAAEFTRPSATPSSGLIQGISLLETAWHTAGVAGSHDHLQALFKFLVVFVEC